MRVKRYRAPDRDGGPTGPERGGKPRLPGHPIAASHATIRPGSAALDLGETVEHDVAKAPRLTESASAVFAVLAGAGTATRPQLASLAGLSKPTVSSAVAELETAGLAAHSGIASGGTGRSAAVYALGPAAGAVLAVDLGPALTRVRGCALDGTLLAEATGSRDARPPTWCARRWPRSPPTLRCAPSSWPSVTSPRAPRRAPCARRPPRRAPSSTRWPWRCRPVCPSTSRTTSTAPRSPSCTRARRAAGTPSAICGSVSVSVSASSSGARCWPGPTGRPESSPGCPTRGTTTWSPATRPWRSTSAPAPCCAGPPRPGRNPTARAPVPPSSCSRWPDRAVPRPARSSTGTRWTSAGWPPR